MSSALDPLWRDRQAAAEVRTSAGSATLNATTEQAATAYESAPRQLGVPAEPVPKVQNPIHPSGSSGFPLCGNYGRSIKSRRTSVRERTLDRIGQDMQDRKHQELSPSRELVDLAQGTCT